MSFIEKPSQARQPGGRYYFPYAGAAAVPAPRLSPEIWQKSLTPHRRSLMFCLTLFFPDVLQMRINYPYRSGFDSKINLKPPVLFATKNLAAR